MAGAGYKLFNTGDVLTAAQVNTYLQEQTVMVFASAAARTTALSGVLAEGMMSYLTDTDLIQYYNGSAWTTVNTDQTPLTTKGDLFTYSTTDARLAVGNNGETLVADSSATTGLRWQGNPAAGKNAAINGGMDIWQRGTPFSGAGIYSADRWYTGVGNTTYAQETSVVPTGFRYAMKMTTTAINTAPTIWQAIETANAIQYAGQTVTLSYYARSTDAVNALVRLDYSNSADVGIAGSWTNITTSNFATTSTGYTRVSFQFAVPSTAQSLRIIIGANANLSNGGSFYISGVQLELGSVATTFSRAGGTLAGELAACQRYFQVFCDTSSYGEITGQFYSTTAARFTRPLLVSLRTTNPTITFPSGTFTNFIEEVGIANRTPTAFSANGSSKTHITFSATGMTGATTNSMAAFTTSATAITISSEL